MSASDAMLERMRRRSLELDRLMRLQFQSGLTIDEFLRDAVKTASDMLEVARASVWLYTPNRQAIRCACLYDASIEGYSDKDTIGDLKAVDYPSYFQALSQARVVEAHDALNDARTCEFADSYLKPLNIRSMMDAQIPSAEGVRGVVCLEAVGQQRIWTPDESFFAAALAGQVGVQYERAERARVSERLKRALGDAKKANAARSAFLANMSHEIRTPLNGVLGMAQALSASALEREQAEQVEVIIDSGESLLAIVNDVLDLSKIDAGKLELHPVEGSLFKVVTRVVKLMEPRAREKGLSITSEFSPASHAGLRFDPIRVGQCLTNLISNAIKFTETGGIEVHVKDDGDKGFVIAVADTGIGIAEDQQCDLFSEFTQLDTSTTRNHGGTGLGLAITRRLARLMGGDVSVSSKPGEGSLFSFSFKAEIISSADANDPTGESVSAPKPLFNGMRMLLVDDNVINRRIVETLTRPLNIDFASEADGQSALDRLAKEQFDIVIMDVHMPRMDGVETVRRLRQAGHAMSDVPIVALTADAMSGDREKFLTAGMDGYASKPIVATEFFSEVLKVLDERQAA